MSESGPYSVDKSYTDMPHDALSSVESLFASLIRIRDENEDDTPALTHNLNMTRNLMRCMEQNNCKPNQMKVAILGSQYFSDALGGGIGGEQIWAKAVIIAATNANYTSLVAMGDSYELSGSIFWMFQLVRDLVKVVVGSPEWIQGCVESTTCIYDPTQNPQGVPVWMTLSFSFWTASNHPLGPSWTLNPEPYPLENPGYPPNFYLGYSVEPNCLSEPFIPPEERKHQMYVMGKYLHYFSGEGSAWTADFYDEAAQVNGLSFVVGASPSPDADNYPVSESTLPKSIVNHGIMPPEEFTAMVANSRMLVGVGSPYTSPTPYDALCLGVPFLNAIKQWDHSDPWNRDKWDIQHGLLKLLDPPYVYNVHTGDKKAFLKAIKGALENPLPDRYILERMKMASLEKRVTELMVTDWERKAAEVAEKPME